MSDTSFAPVSTSPSRRLVGSISLFVLMFVFGLLSRMSMTGLPPIYDELYHLLPAMSLQDNGTFAILDGIYDRTSLFTRFVSWTHDLAGNRDPGPVRIVLGSVPGALLVAMMVVWTYRRLNLAAALVVAIFLLFWPNGIEVSQYIRFYAVHGLFFTLATLMVYAAFETAPSTRVAQALLIGAAVLFYMALQLQLTTLIGVGAIGIWVAIVHLPGWLRDHGWLRWGVLAAMLLVLAILASGVANDTLRGLWTTYRWEPWPAPDDRTFYHRDYRDNYPVFWSLFPLAAIIALSHRFRLAAFCLIVFAVPFVLQSFGGLKNIRYLYPVTPFFFVLWAIALDATAKAGLRMLRERTRSALAPVLPRVILPLGVGLIIVASILFTLGSNVAFIRSARMIVGSETQFLLGKRRWQWPEARALAEPWLQRDALIVTSDELLAVEWLGDYDFALNKPRFSELFYSIGPETTPFTPDLRTGRPIAGEREQFRPIIACAPLGLYITTASLSGDVQALSTMAEETGARTRIERGAGALILVWERDGIAPQADCSDVPQRIGDGAAARILSGQSPPTNR